MAAPRFVIIPGDPAHLEGVPEAVLALISDDDTKRTRAVVDTAAEVPIAYPFGDLADMAAESFNNGTKPFDGEPYAGSFLTEVERDQLDRVLAGEAL
jgi:hypothetical protein